MPLTKSQSKCSSQSKAQRKTNAGMLPALPGEFGSASLSRQALSPWQQCSAGPTSPSSLGPGQDWCWKTPKAISTPFTTSEKHQLCQGHAREDFAPLYLL